MTKVWEFAMRKCLHLAEKGEHFVGLNPLVGSVLVRDGEIIAEGYHAGYGMPHAERDLLQKLPDNMDYSGCTLVVNLEPCNHFGKTPPCTDIIISKQIPQVVIGALDPNPLVSGKGRERLLAHGIKVVTGVLPEDCIQLNRQFYTRMIHQRSYCIAKWAATTDGYIGNQSSQRLIISGEEAQQHLHVLRSRVDAILVGVNTWEKDKPRLDSRILDSDVESSESWNPIRIILDPNLRGNYSSESIDRVFSPIWILNGEIEETKKSERGNDVKFIKLPENWIWQELLSMLYQNNIGSVLVEGGSTTLKELIASGCVDEYIEYRNTALRIGGGLEAPDFPNDWQQQQLLGRDLLRVYKVPISSDLYQ